MKKFLLKQKVALSLVIISFFSLLIIGVTVFLYIRSILIENKKTEILTSTIEQAHESTLTFKNNQSFVNILSTLPQVKEFLSNKTESKKTEILNILLEYTNVEKKYLSISLLDKNGIGLVSTDSRFVGQDYSLQEYFKKASQGAPTIDTDIDKITNQFGYYFSNPIFGIKGDVVGVMVVKVDQSEIDNPIILSSLSKGNILMLVDAFGIIISSSDNSRKFKSLGTLSVQAKNTLQESERFSGQDIVPLQYDLVQQGITDYKDPINLNFYDKQDGENEIININKLVDLPFYLVSEIRLDTLNNQLFNTVFTIVLIILIILFILSFIIYFLLVSFLRPLNKFKLFFTRISSGDFSQGIKIDTKDEFSDLAESVNKMSEDLSGLYKNLDEKVKEQTAKMEKEKINAERSASELEKFKLAVDNSFDQITITDVDGIVVYVNKTVERITGFKVEEVMGKKIANLWKAPMPTEYYENMWDIIKYQKKSFVGEIKNKRKNGEIYTAMVNISSVLNKDGDIVYFIETQRDITKEKEIDKAKTEFVSLASHQLRSPLSAINWYTEMLLDKSTGPLNDTQKDYLDEISSGNKRMIDLVNDFLNVSRLDMGVFNLDTKPLDVLILIKNILEESKPEILEKKLIINESYDKDIPKFWADEKLLRVVLENLVSNAVKYTQPNKVVKISLSEVNKGEKLGGKIIDKESLVFSISDSGMGIPTGQQEKIFSKLFRADNAKESEAEGTGLGLYVSKSIVDLSGGLIWFESKEGEGSTFYVVFPISGMEMK